MSDDDIDDAKPHELVDKSEAARLLKCSIRQVQRFAANGKLSSTTQGKGNPTKFLKSEVLELKEERDDSVEMSDDMTLLVNEMRKGLEIANRHVNNLLQNVVEPLKLHNDALNAEMSAIRARYDALLDRHLGSLDKWEESTKAVHEREIASFTVKENEKRKSEAWTFATQTLLPRLLSQFAGTQVVQDLIGSFSDEQLEALLNPELGFLNTEQREKLEHVLKHAKATQDAGQHIREPVKQGGEGSGPVGSSNGGSN